MFYYRALIILFSPVILGYIIWKAASNKHQQYFWQRLGFFYGRTPEKCLWFHCASVGEVNTALPLLKNLHKKNQRLNFIITTNTITGRKIIQQQALDYLHHRYLPFDWQFSINRFISKLKPDSLYILETEIWPNLFHVCHKKNIKINIINARLSSKTTTANAWIKSLLKTALLKVDSISARSEQDAQAYKLLGANKSCVSVVGNLKFTTVLNKKTSTRTDFFSLERDYVLVASTHNNEELQIYTAWKKLNRDELLIIAPRHPERSASISKQLHCDNLAIRSKNQTITTETKVFLLDTVGELKNYFKNAKLVVMGGSFVTIGGHNILEPAAFNKAIITGPYMENFKQELALMVKQKAIIQAASISDLSLIMENFLDSEESRTSLQTNTTLLANDVEKVLHNYTDLILSTIPE